MLRMLAPEGGKLCNALASLTSNCHLMHGLTLTPGILRCALILLRFQLAKWQMLAGSVLPLSDVTALVLLWTESLILKMRSGCSFCASHRHPRRLLAHRIFRYWQRSATSARLVHATLLSLYLLSGLVLLGLLLSYHFSTPGHLFCRLFFLIYFPGLLSPSALLFAPLATLLMAIMAPKKVEFYHQLRQ
jgi:hypothetical protein